MYDTIIIGGGPSGMSAAIGLSSEGVQVVVLEKGKLGGAVAASNRVENYPCGLATELTGSDFAYYTEQQARQFGVAFFVGPQYRVVEAKKYDGLWRVFTDEEIFTARTVVVAIGTAHRQLDIIGLEGPNVIYDGVVRPVAWPKQRVVVLGGGNSAGQAVEHLVKAGANVTLITHRPIEASMSNYLVNRIVNSGIHYMVGELIQATSYLNGTYDLVLEGNRRVESVTVVYVFAGSQPNTNWLEGLVVRDSEGYIKRAKLRGMWVVGDVRSGAVRRLSCAVGSGNEIVPKVYKYLRS